MLPDFIKSKKIVVLGNWGVVLALIFCGFMLIGPVINAFYYPNNSFAPYATRLSDICYISLVTSSIVAVLNTVSLLFRRVSAQLLRRFSLLVYTLLSVNAVLMLISIT